MRILEVIPSYPPTSQYTGPPANLHRLCREMIELGAEIRVVTTNDNGTSKVEMAPNSWTQYEGVPVFYGNRVGWRGDYSIAAWGCIRQWVPLSDIIHVAPIFSWPLLAVSRYGLTAKRPYVISPRGSLRPEALAISRIRKRVFMYFGGERALVGASAFHATSEEEAIEINKMFPASRTEVVANGVQLPDQRLLAEWKGTRTERYVLYLGRLHPIKNLPVLLEAWASTSGKATDMTLKIVGPDDLGMRDALERQIGMLGLLGRVTITGRHDGLGKSQLLAQAEALVLPSLSENFGNVVAEALAHETPVIASKGTPWSGLRLHNCGWWVEPTVSGLASGFTALFESAPAELAAMGSRGRAWVKKDFAWSAVAARMLALYQGVLAMNQNQGRSEITI
jgi:glycosyltransferase involved in cell wall biosynthesis